MPQRQKNASLAKVFASRLTWTLVLNRLLANHKRNPILQLVSDPFLEVTATTEVLSTSITTTTAYFRLCQENENLATQRKTTDSPWVQDSTRQLNQFSFPTRRPQPQRQNGTSYAYRPDLNRFSSLLAPPQVTLGTRNLAQNQLGQHYSPCQSSLQSVVDIIVNS